VIEALASFDVCAFDGFTQLATDPDLVTFENVVNVVFKFRLPPAPVAALVMLIEDEHAAIACLSPLAELVILIVEEPAA
jgi:hypothetical protein